MKRPVQISFCSAALILCAVQSNAAPPDRNIVIMEGAETYCFVPDRKGLKVTHRVRDRFTATLHSEKFQPHIFINDMVSLDRAEWYGDIYGSDEPQFRNVNQPTVFHDGGRVCYFNGELRAKDKKATVEFRRTFTNPALFTGFYPQQEYNTENKTITVEIPASLPGIELVDLNFPATGISRSETPLKDGGRRITYTLTDLQQEPDDEQAPSAKKSLPYVMVRGYFPDTDSLYRFHRRLIDVDTVIPSNRELLDEITATVTAANPEGCRIATIEAIYRYVQQKIRYVAFEQGEAAWRPDAPAEVLRKRFGDCKGMAKLLATLLERAGIPAYVAVVGTNDIPFRISENPSLAASDHMICVVPDGDGYLWLDPTYRTISMRHIPGTIRGKDAMIMLPDGYIMADIPEQSPVPSSDTVTYSYALVDDTLAGDVTKVCTEDFAEPLDAALATVPGQNRKEIMARYLIPGVSAALDPDRLNYDESQPGRVLISSPIMNPEAIVEADGSVYIDLNAQCGKIGKQIDLEDRRQDLDLGVPGTITRKSEVTLPQGVTAVLPENFTARTPWADMKCVFQQTGNCVSMTKSIEIKSSRIPLARLPEWNRQLRAWNEACSNQIEIKRAQ